MLNLSYFHYNICAQDENVLLRTGEIDRGKKERFMRGRYLIHQTGTTGFNFDVNPRNKGQ